MPPSFLARLRPRRPFAGPHGQDEGYVPAMEGAELLGTGVDHLRAYLMLHPTRLEALNQLCAPIGDHIRAKLSSPAECAPCTIFTHTTRAVSEGRPALWEALLQDLLDSTGEGPGLTVSPLIVLMSGAISEIIYASSDTGLLFASSEARAAAAALREQMPFLMPAVIELVSVSRDAIGLRAARIGIDSVLVHRRFSTVMPADILRLHTLGPRASSQPVDADVVDTVMSMVPLRTLAVWSANLADARNWPAGEDPGTQSSVVLSIRAPVSSLWLAPCPNRKDFLISPDDLTLAHVEVLHRV